MQGQRSGTGFEQESPSNVAGLDQQMFWNDINVEDYHGQPFSEFDLLESSSMLGSNVGSLNDQKAEHRWSPIHAFDGNVHLPESQEHRHSTALSAGNFANGSLLVQNSGSSQLPQGLNNSRFVDEDDDCQILHETPPIFNKPGSSRTQTNPSGAPNPLGMSNESPSDSRCSPRKRKALDGIVEQPSGSRSGSSSFIQHSNSSLRHPIPNAATPLGASSHSLNLSEHVNPSLGSSTRQVASRSSTLVANSGSMETSRRNTRPRINGTHHQCSQSSSMLNIESATGNTNLSSRQHSRNSLTIRPPTAAAAANTILGAQQVVVQPSISLPRNLQPAGNSSSGSRTRNSSSIPVSGERSGASVNPSNSRVVSTANTNLGAQQVVVQPSISLHRNLQPAGNSSSGSRTRNSSSVPVSGERSGASVNPSNSRVVSRNISDHPMFAQPSESRNFLQSAHSWGIANGNVNNPGNVASSSQNRAGANAHVHPVAPSWIPQQSPLQNISRSTESSRRIVLPDVDASLTRFIAQNSNQPSLQNISRLTESSRRTVLPAVDAGFIAQNSNQPSLHSGPSLSQVVSLSSGSRRLSRPSQSRQPMLLERPTNGAVGAPVSTQAFAAAVERQSAVLEQIHRFRLQAEMVAHPAVYYAMIDMHDQHRDMRLDVDNMSYEQLLALEERMGNVNVGLTEESIMKQLKQKKHTRRNKDKTETEPCCICQEEYNVGEVVGTLDCGHDFHSQCIKQWLMQKNICPICKTTGLIAK